MFSREVPRRSGTRDDFQNEQNLASLLNKQGYSLSELHMCFQPRSADRHSRIFFKFKLGRNVFELFPRLGATLLVVANVKPTTVQ